MRRTTIFYFKGKQFEKDIIMVAVDHYLRYGLSYRGISETFTKHMINSFHATVYR